MRLDRDRVIDRCVVRRRLLGNGYLIYPTSGAYTSGRQADWEDNGNITLQYLSRRMALDYCSKRFGAGGTATAGERLRAQLF